MRTLAIWLLITAASAVEFTTTFAPGEGGWTMRPGSSTSLVFPATGAEPGLKWKNEVLAVASREIDLGTSPCEWSADVRLTAGRAADWRCAGIGISLGSATADTAGIDDWGITFAAREQGPLAMLHSGKPAWGVELRPGVWNLVTQSLTKRFQLSMGGAGGSD
jgi:hypothetical protein